MQVARESADRPEPHRVPVLPTAGEGRPRNRVLDCDPVIADGVQVVQELAEPHTIASYRDTIRLLLTYASRELGVEPSRLDLGQLDAPLVGAFLDHLETDRGCGARTRNTRLAAIQTFYRYCMLRHPEHAATIERVLQIGPKRHERALVTYLTEPELDALIDAPDRST